MTPPAFEDVQDYCLSRRNGIDSGAVLDYYESVGWMVGKKKMKDWQAAVRTWERRQKQMTPRVLKNMVDRSWAS
jgi:archaellum component FlaD/FlaE